MALLVCPDCKKKVSETAKVCPKCGFTLTPQKVKEIKEADAVAKGIGCIVVAVLFAGWGLYSSITPSTPTKQAPPPPPLTQQQKAEAAAWEAKYAQQQAQFRSSLNKASTAQLRKIFISCRAMVEDLVRKDYKGPFDAVVVDETSPDSYQAVAGLSGGSYSSTEQRIARFVDNKKRGNNYPELDLDLRYTAIFLGESFSGVRKIPHTYECSLAPDLTVRPPREIP